MYFDPRTQDHNLAHSPYTALAVPRPIGWISTIGPGGIVNLAPYSFYNMVSAYPPFVMFASSPRKDSQRNAEQNGEFVVNIATYELKDLMNASSANFAADEGEPAALGIEMTPSRQVKPPRVALTPAALECKYYKTVELFGSDGKRNPSSVILGEVVGVYIDNAVIVDGMVDVTRFKPLGRLGYFDYCVVDRIFSMPRPTTPEHKGRGERR